VQGLGKFDERQASYKSLLAGLNFTVAENGVKSAQVGKGRFLMADEVVPLLEMAGVARETLTDNGLSFVRRTFKTGDSYFIDNKSDKPIDGWVPLTVKATSVVIFDAMTGKSGLAKIKPIEKGQTSVYLQLQPGESCVLQTSPTAITGAAFKYQTVGGDAVPIAGNWNLKFLEGGPTLPAAIQTADLKSWTDLGGDDAKAFSGTGSYSITFNKPAGAATAWQLDLGKVHEEAEVFLNGIKLATLIGPQYVVTIPAAQLKPVNKLEVRVANLMANRAIYMDRNNIPYKIFYNTNFPSHGRDTRGADGLFTAAKWDWKPSGLMGPVTLSPLKAVIPK